MHDMNLFSLLCLNEFAKTVPIPSFLACKTKVVWSHSFGFASTEDKGKEEEEEKIV